MVAHLRDRVVRSWLGPHGGAHAVGILVGPRESARARRDRKLRTVLDEGGELIRHALARAAAKEEEHVPPERCARVARSLRRWLALQGDADLLGRDPTRVDRVKDAEGRAREAAAIDAAKEKQQHVVAHADAREARADACRRRDCGLRARISPPAKRA